MSRKVKIFDTTLRDGEQTPGVNLTVDQKIEIAKSLENMGVDYIEVGFPAASKNDFDAIREISEVCKEATIAALARSTPGDIKIAADSLSFTENGMIHIFVGTSPIHLQDQMKITEVGLLQLIKETVAYAKSLNLPVRWSAMDATRTSIDSLCQYVQVAIESGADMIGLADTVGYAAPEEIAVMVKRIKENTDLSDTPISIHCHNDLGLAVSNSLTGLRNGADCVDVSMNGIGERAGNTALETIVLALDTRNDFYNRTHDIDIKQIKIVSDQVAGFTGVFVSDQHPVVGKNVFTHESGIHQDGIIKNPLTYEIINPETVGRKSEIFLGKHSGRSGLKKRIQSLGFKLNDQEINKVFDKFKIYTLDKNEVTDKEIINLILEIKKQ